MAPGEPDVVINVGVSGPGVVRSALAKLPADAPLNEVAELIEKIRLQDHPDPGQLVGTEASQMLGVPFWHHRSFVSPRHRP